MGGTPTPSPSNPRGPPSKRRGSPAPPGPTPSNTRKLPAIGGGLPAPDTTPSTPGGSPKPQPLPPPDPDRRRLHPGPPPTTTTAALPQAGPCGDKAEPGLSEPIRAREPWLGARSSSEGPGPGPARPGSPQPGPRRFVCGRRRPAAALRLMAPPAGPGRAGPRVLQTPLRGSGGGCGVLFRGLRSPP